MLDGLLPPDTYFRFNPVMCEYIPLDESRNEKLDQLQLEGLRYIERNEEKMKKLAKILSQEKTTLQKINDWIKLKTDMYEGLPFFSKLWWVCVYIPIMKACSEDPLNSVRNRGVQRQLTLKYLWILGDPEDVAWTSLHSTGGILGFRLCKEIRFLWC